MKWDTKRVEEKNLTGAIAKNIMKHSQEYYILAILRYLYPDRYSKVISRERPDLHSEDIFWFYLFVIVKIGSVIDVDNSDM